MFDSHQKYTGTRYTMTIALLLMALVFSPAVLLMSKPNGYLPITVAIACSAVFAAFAWINWKRHSELTIPSIEAAPVKSK